MSFWPGSRGTFGFILGGTFSATLIFAFQWIFPPVSAEKPRPAHSNQLLSGWVSDPEPEAPPPLPPAPEIPLQIPAEAVELDLAWQPIVMEALKLGSEGNPNKNKRLIQIAVVEAQGVPGVQETCLRHLTFSLSNEEAGELLKLAANQNLPLSGRRYLVDKSLRIRSPEVAGWMAGQLIQHPEPEIAKLANQYLERQRKRAADSANAAAQGDEAPAPESSGPF